MKIRVTVLCALLAVLVASAAAAPLGPVEVRERVESAPALDERPDLDALVLYEGHAVTLRGGLAEHRVQRLVKLYAQWTQDLLGELRLRYDEGRQELIVHASRTWRPDGSSIDSPVNAYNVVTPRGLDRSVDHLGIRELVLTRIALEPGAVVWLDYTLRDLAPGPLPFQMQLLPQGDWPVAAMEIAAEGLAAEAVNPPDGLWALPAPAREDGRLVWRLADLPARPGEAEGRLGDQIPWIALSAAGGWDDLAGALADRLAAAAEDAGDLPERLDELDGETPFVSDREALQAWLDMAGERTALLRFDPWRVTPAPRAVARVLETATATPLERCALLAACCNLRGLEWQLVLPAAAAALPELPVLAALDDPLLRVSGAAAGGGDLILDPAAGSLRGADRLATGLPYLAFEDRGFRRRVEPRAADRIDLRAHWDLVEGTAKAEGRLAGPLAAARGLTEPEAAVRRWAEGWCEGAEVTDVAIFAAGDGLDFRVELAAPMPEEGERGYVDLTLPAPPAVEPDALRPAGMHPERSRCRAVLFRGAAEVHLDWTLRLPGDRPLLTAGAAGEDAEGARFTLAREAAAGRLEVDYRLEWDERTVAPGAYPDFRRLVLAALDPSARRVVLGPATE